MDRVLLSTYGLLLAASLDLRTAGVAEDRSRLLFLLQTQPRIERLDGSPQPRATFFAYRDRDPASATHGLEFCVVEAARASYALHTMSVRLSRNPETVFEAAAHSNTIAILNGGFFGVNHEGGLMPLGFEKSGGRVKSPISSWRTGGVLTFGHGAAHIVPIKAFADNDRVLEAIQSKPMLVDSGKDGIRSATPGRFDRSAVAITEDGAVLFAVIHDSNGQAATLAEFSALLTQLRSSAGASVVRALAMDGGPGAHLYVPSIRCHCGSGLPSFIPNIVVLSR